jgi:hypothetical protein
VSIVDRYPVLSSYQEVAKYDFANCWTAVDRTRLYSDVDVAAAILFTGGNYSKIAALLNRSRTGVKLYIEANREVFELRYDLVQGKLDEIEDLQFAEALGGHLETGRFLLKALGKDRGYSDRVESTGADGGAIDTHHTVEFVSSPNAAGG